MEKAMKEESLAEGRARRVPVARHADARGLLSAIDLAGAGVPVRRAFVVSAPANSVRGGHGHASGRQVLLCAGGEVEVELRWPGGGSEVVLRPGEPGLLIEPGVWARQRYRGESPVLVVFCDTDFDPDDYVAECPE
jgi:dTDP-4-dehydrorhamnose 3,5-epimerase-like enzyme